MPSERTKIETRAKIKATWLIKKLNEHIERAEGAMVPSAVTAALGLLRKVAPDLQAIEHTGVVAVKPAELMTDDELAAIAASGSGAPDQAPVDPAKLN